MALKVQKTDAEWRAELTPEQYHIMREKGTERAFTGALYYNKDVFEEYGVDYPTADWTYAEYLDAMKRLTRDRDGDGPSICG